MNAYVASLCILYKISNVHKFIMYKFFMNKKKKCRMRCIFALLHTVMDKK